MESTLASNGVDIAHMVKLAIGPGELSEVSTCGITR